MIFEHEVPFSTCFLNSHVGFPLHFNAAAWWEGGKSHLECFTLCIFFILGMLSSVICLKKSLSFSLALFSFQLKQFACKEWKGHVALKKLLFSSWFIIQIAPLFFSHCILCPANYKSNWMLALKNNGWSYSSGQVKLLFRSQKLKVQLYD